MTDMPPREPDAHQTFLAQTFDHWREEFRLLLEDHRREIQARLEKIEREIEKKSDKETVEVMMGGARDELRRHADDIKCLYRGLGEKVSIETMWKVTGLVLTLGGIIAGIVSFLLNLLVRGH
ncbi:MAG: hypothetical protein ACYDBB_08805 [Armatimonadota bacterium]